MLLEVTLSIFLLYLYRWNVEEFHYESSSFSIVNATQLIIRKLTPNHRDDQADYLYRKQTTPNTFNIPDPVLGYVSKPGRYERIYQKKKPTDENWQSLKVNVTINHDGSRWTGGEKPTQETDQPSENNPTVYIYGDSFVFGIGVNDEHTFSYLLQQQAHNHTVKLFALGGYSLTQALINFRRQKHTITEQDILILGYADFYNDRHVLSPAHLLGKQRWFARQNPALIERNYLLPKVVLDQNGAPQINYIHENCAENNGYCNQASPSSMEMAKTSAAIINYVSRETKANVFVLHLRGPKNDPVFDLLDPKVNVIHATNSDFKYHIQDDIEGFDRHPGPYWHYAISNRLFQTLEPLLNSDVNQSR